jgi:hypothetical protein
MVDERRRTADNKEFHNCHSGVPRFQSPKHMKAKYPPLNIG